MTAKQLRQPVQPLGAETANRMINGTAGSVFNALGETRRDIEDTAVNMTASHCVDIVARLAKNSVPPTIEAALSQLSRRAISSLATVVESAELVEQGETQIQRNRAERIVSYARENDLYQTVRWSES